MTKEQKIICVYHRPARTRPKKRNVPLKIKQATSMEMNNHASVVPQVGSAAAGVALIILWGVTYSTLLPDQPPGIYMPGLSRNNNNKMADMPVEVAMAAGASSIAAKRCSKLVTVGLPSRE